jgi:hypothetical protein
LRTGRRLPRQGTGIPGSTHPWNVPALCRIMT